MRRALKTSFRFIQQCVNTLWSFGLVLLFSDWRPTLKQFRRAGGDCVILGNGPSLSNALSNNSAILRGRAVVCMNEFFDSGQLMTIRPQYYIATDPAYWSHETSQQRQLRYRSYADKLATEVSWPLIIFLPHAAKAWNYFQAVPTRNPNITICYVNTTQLALPTFCTNAFYRNNLAMPTMQSVLLAAIFIALNLGFTKVYILGGDNSWHEQLFVDPNNVLNVSYSRFHEIPNPSPTPFTQDPQDQRPYTVPEFFSWLALVFRGYHEVNTYAQQIGAAVYNLSEKSYIDAFHRLRINDVPPLSRPT